MPQESIDIIFLDLQFSYVGMSVDEYARFVICIQDKTTLAIEKIAWFRDGTDAIRYFHERYCKRPVEVEGTIDAGLV